MIHIHMSTLYCGILYASTTLPCGLYLATKHNVKRSLEPLIH